MKRVSIIQWKPGDRVLCHGNEEPGVIVEQRDDVRRDGEDLEVFKVQLDSGRWTLMAADRMKREPKT